MLDEIALGHHHGNKACLSSPPLRGEFPWLKVAFVLARLTPRPCLAALAPAPALASAARAGSAGTLGNERLASP